jgi:hypothetical protein
MAPDWRKLLNIKTSPISTALDDSLHPLITPLSSSPPHFTDWFYCEIAR